MEETQDKISTPGQNKSPATFHSLNAKKKVHFPWWLCTPEPFSFEFTCTISGIRELLASNILLGNRHVSLLIEESLFVSDSSWVWKPSKRLHLRSSFLWPSICCSLHSKLSHHSGIWSSCPLHLWRLVFASYSHWWEIWGICSTQKGLHSGKVDVLHILLPGELYSSLLPPQRYFFLPNMARWKWNMP